MARHASNYRQARRAAWRALNKEGVNGFVPWDLFNAKVGYGIGTPRSTYQINVRRDWRGLHVSPKYMPHIGAKQRAKGLARSA